MGSSEKEATVTLAQGLSQWLTIKSDDIDNGLAADFDGSLSGLGVELGSSTYNMSEALLALPSFKQEAITPTPRFQYILGALTSPATKVYEETLTYLNQGQSYEIKLKLFGEFEELNGQLMKSIVRVVFHEKRLQFMEKENLCRWKQTRPGERILDVDIPLSYGISLVDVDPLLLNCISFKWDPSKECGIFIKVNCISTEFTAKKHGGEKGVPFRIQVETYLDSDEECLMHAGSCQVKVFKPKGADRKNKTDREKMEKRLESEKSKFQPSYECTVLTEISLDQVISYLQQNEVDSTLPEYATTCDSSYNFINLSLNSGDESMSNSCQLTTDNRVIESKESKSEGSPVRSFEAIIDSNANSGYDQMPQLSTTLDYECSNCSDDYSDAISVNSTANEVQGWLQNNRFNKYSKIFLSFSGADLLRLNREDLIQICGIADGIRMNNALQARAIRPKLTMFICQEGMYNRRRSRASTSSLEVKLTEREILPCKGDVEKTTESRLIKRSRHSSSDVRASDGGDTIWNEIAPEASSSPVDAAEGVALLNPDKVKDNWKSSETSTQILSLPQPINSPISRSNSADENEKNPVFTSQQSISTSQQPISTCKQLVNTCKQPISTCKQPISTCKQPISTCKQPISTCKQPISTCKQPISTCKQPISTCKQPISSSQQSTSTSHQSTSTSHQSTSTSQQSTSTSQQPTNTCKQATSTCKETTSTCKEAPSTCKEASHTCKEAICTCKQTSSTCKQTRSTCQQASSNRELFVSSQLERESTCEKEQHDGTCEQSASTFEPENRFDTCQQFPSTCEQLSNGRSYSQAEIISSVSLESAAAKLRGSTTSLTSIGAAKRQHTEEPDSDEDEGISCSKKQRTRLLQMINRRAYHALYLDFMTLSCVLEKICPLYGITPRQVKDTYVLGPNNVLFLCTDQVVQNFEDMSRFSVQAVEDEFDELRYNITLKILN